MPRQRIFEVPDPPAFRRKGGSYTIVAFRHRAPEAAQGANGPQWGIWETGLDEKPKEIICFDAFHNADETFGAHAHVGPNGDAVDLVGLDGETPVEAAIRYFNSSERLRELFTLKGQVLEPELLAFIQANSAEMFERLAA